MGFTSAILQETRVIHLGKLYLTRKISSKVHISPATQSNYNTPFTKHAGVLIYKINSKNQYSTGNAIKSQLHTQISVSTKFGLMNCHL